MKLLLLTLALASYALAMPLAEGEKPSELPQISVDYSSVAKNEEKPAAADLAAPEQPAEAKPEAIAEPKPSEKPAEKESDESSEEDHSAENKSEENASNESGEKPAAVEKPLEEIKELVAEADKKIDLVEAAKKPAALADESAPSDSHHHVQEPVKEALPEKSEAPKEALAAPLPKEEEKRSEDQPKEEAKPVAAEPIKEAAAEVKPVEAESKVADESKPVDAPPAPLLASSIVAPAAVAEEKAPEVKPIESEKSEESKETKASDLTLTTAAPVVEEKKEQIPALVAEKEITLSDKVEPPKPEEKAPVSADNTDRVVRETEAEKKDEHEVHEDEEESKSPEEKILEPVALPAAQELPKKEVADEKHAPKSEEKSDSSSSEEDEKPAAAKPAEALAVAASEAPKPKEVGVVEHVSDAKSEVKLDVQADEKPAAVAAEVPEQEASKKVAEPSS